MTVLPAQVCVPKAFEAFHENGSLKDEKKQSGVAGLGASLAQLLAKIAA